MFPCRKIPVNHVVNNTFMCMGFQEQQEITFFANTKYTHNIMNFAVNQRVVPSAEAVHIAHNEYYYHFDDDVSKLIDDMEQLSKGSSNCAILPTHNLFANNLIGKFILIVFIDAVETEPDDRFGDREFSIAIAEFESCGMADDDDEEQDKAENDDSLDTFKDESKNTPKRKLPRSFKMKPAYTLRQLELCVGKMLGDTTIVDSLRPDEDEESLKFDEAKAADCLQNIRNLVYGQYVRSALLTFHYISCSTLLSRLNNRMMYDLSSYYVNNVLNYSSAGSSDGAMEIYSSMDMFATQPMCIKLPQTVGGSFDLDDNEEIKVTCLSEDMFVIRHDHFTSEHKLFSVCLNHELILDPGLTTFGIMRRFGKEYAGRLWKSLKKADNNSKKVSIGDSESDKSSNSLIVGNDNPRIELLMPILLRIPRCCGALLSSSSGDILSANYMLMLSTVESSSLIFSTTGADEVQYSITYHVSASDLSADYDDSGILYSFCFKGSDLSTHKKFARYLAKYNYSVLMTESDRVILAKGEEKNKFTDIYEHLQMGYYSKYTSELIRWLKSMRAANSYLMIMPDDIIVLLAKTCIDMALNNDL